MRRQTLAGRSRDEQQDIEKVDIKGDISVGNRRMLRARPPSPKSLFRPPLRAAQVVEADRLCFGPALASMELFSIGARLRS
jgi:hypothetical protein